MQTSKVEAHSGRSLHSTLHSQHLLPILAQFTHDSADSCLSGPSQRPVSLNQGSIVVFNRQHSKLVGVLVGFTEGPTVGFTEGNTVGFTEGKNEGPTVGSNQGLTVGFTVGNPVGSLLPGQRAPRTIERVSPSISSPKLNNSNTLSYSFSSPPSPNKHSPTP